MRFLLLKAGPVGVDRVRPSQATEPSPLPRSWSTRTYKPAIAGLITQNGTKPFVPQRVGEYSNQHES